MGPIVAVDIAPAPDPGSKELGALLDACSRALPQGTCQASGALEEKESSARARVDWQDSAVLIQVQLGGDRDWLGRGMYFAPEDEPVERWRTVGLTIATIVDELEERRAEQPPVALEPAPEPVPKAPQPAPAASPAARGTSPAPAPGPAVRHELPEFNSVEAGSAAASALTAGTSRVGLYLRLAHDLTGVPVSVDTGLGYAVSARPGEPVLTWFEASLGGGAHAVSDQFRLELGMSALLRRTSATASEPETGQIDDGASWLPGLALTARTTFPATTPIAVVFGLNGSWLARELVITNAGREVRRLPPYSVGMVVGLRVNWQR